MTLTIGMIKSNSTHYRFKPISFFTFSWNRRKKKNINHHPRKGDPRIERRQDEVTVLQELEIRCPPPPLISVVHTRVYTCAGRVISADKTSLFNREAREASSVRLITGNTERGVFSPSLSLSLRASAHPSCRRVLDTEGARPGCNTRVYAIKSAGVPLLIG